MAHPDDDREKTAALVEAKLYRPGVLRCAKCGFRLVSNVLNAATGNVHVHDTTANCPNDGAPMWRVSWEEECRESDRCWEQQVERAVAAEEALARAGELARSALLADEHQRLEALRKIIFVASVRTHAR